MANFFQKTFTGKPKLENRTRFDETDYASPFLGSIPFNSTSLYNPSKALKLSTVYRCVNLISDSVACLPLIPQISRVNANGNSSWKYTDFGNSLYDILNIAPNSFMGAYMLKKLAIINMLLKGSAYILIDRTNTGDVTSLTLLNSDYVYIYINGALITELVDLTAIMTGGNVDVTYHYVLNGHIYDKSQIIHLINYPDATGLRGISTLAYAAETLGIAYDTQTHSGSFFRSGANLSGVLHAIAGVTLLKGQAQKAKESFVQALSPALGGTSGGIVALDSGMEFQPISVNPKDSQMIENKAFNVLEICRYFNVPPSLAFSESARHAATAEQQGLGFLNDCLLPLLEKVENEFFRKLYLQSDWKLSSLKFNTENLLRLDATTKADVAAKLFGIGAKTANEIRSDYDAEFPVQGGNTAFVSTNLQPINDLVVSGTAKANTPTKPTSGSTTQNNIDNKLLK